MAYDLSEFLTKPGLAGWNGGLMDEYARAAVDFCNAVEAVEPAKFTQDVKPSPDPDCTSIHGLCVHVLAAANGYGNSLLRALQPDAALGTKVDASSVRRPGDVRPALALQLRRTERIVADIAKLPEAEQEALEVKPRWHSPLRVDLMLEHAIVHLLRHRRQIERW
jgi:hypothetical protein